MTEDLQLLNEFRSEALAPDDELRRRVYAYATHRGAEPPRWRLPVLRYRILVPVAVAAALASAVLLGVLVVSAGQRQGGISGATSRNAQAFINGFSALKQQGVQGLAHSASSGPGPTMEQPLDPPATQVTLDAATAAFGSPVVLPSTPTLGPADAGPVWEATKGSTSTVAVTYPAQGVIIGYVRPAVYSDPATGYQQLSEGIASSQVVDLNGTTPALVIPQNSDETGASFGVVAFETNGTEVRVMGHSDTPTLEAIAQSILDRS